MEISSMLAGSPGSSWQGPELDSIIKIVLLIIQDHKMLIMN